MSRAEERRSEGAMFASKPRAYDETRFRSVLGHFASGVAVVTAMTDGRPCGLTIQSFCSLSLEPPLILFCPSRTSTSWPHVAAAGELCVNLLAHDQADLARQFSRSGADKFAGVKWTASEATGSPVIEGSLAWIECRLESVQEAGDHLIAIAEVLALAARTEGRPLIFYKAGFQQIL